MTISVEQENQEIEDTTKQEYGGSYQWMEQKFKSSDIKAVPPKKRLKLSDIKAVPPKKRSKLSDMSQLEEEQLNPLQMTISQLLLVVLLLRNVMSQK